MPSRSMGICENHRSGVFPPTAFFITAPKPAADGKTGSHTAPGTAAHAGHLELHRTLAALPALPGERQLDGGAGPAACPPVAAM